MAKEMKTSLEQLRAIVQAGMSVTEARALLDDGYAPDEVLSLAHLQAETRTQQAASTQAAQATAQAQAFEKAQNPSLKVTTQVSHFNPRGEKDFPMPALKCEFHAPWKIHPAYHGLDREEVELFNLLEPGEYTVQGNDEAPLKLRIIARTNDATGAVERMDFKCDQFTAEHKGQRLPAMRAILRDILGDKAAGVRPMTEERKLIATGKLAVSVA